MKRLIDITGILLAAVLLCVGIASAASLGIGTGQLAAGNVAVGGCTSSSLTATRNVDNSGNVTQVDVTGVPQACSGETLAVTLRNSSQTSLATASTTVGACSGGCTVSLTGFGTVSAASLTAYSFSLTQ